MRAAVQQIGLALAAPFAHGVQGVDHAHQQGRAVGHRRVHHLATAGLAGVQPRGQHAQRQEHGAAAASATRFSGGIGWPAPPMLCSAQTAPDN